MPDFRAYCRPPESEPVEIRLPAEESHHLITVNRCSRGDPVVVFDGHGREWITECIEASKSAAVLRVKKSTPAAARPAALTLAQVLPKGATMDDIVHRGSLGQYLREREGRGTCGGGRGLFDAENCGRFAGLDTFSDPFAAVTIEDHHGITAAAAVDRDQMMALLGGEADFHRFALRRPAISAEVRHA